MKRLGWIVVAAACSSRPSATPSAPATTVASDAAPPAPVAELPDPEPLRAAAEAETDPARQREAWARAAEAYDVIATHPAASDDERLAAMRAAVDAWRRALHVEPRVKGVDEADDHRARDARAASSFLRLAEADPGEIGARFHAGKLSWRSGNHALAVTVLAPIVRDHPADEHAPYAATMILDALNRAGHGDELLTWVDEMRASPALLEGRQELAELLDSLHRQRPSGK